ncbi:MAG: AP-4 complex subunit mu [archaeon]|nr:AP-4 complex subunit mu [archaeon]
MSVSQLFILSLRGDTIIYRDFRKDLHKGINEIFFRKVNFYSGEETAPPVFNEEGINFIYVKKNELYIVLATKDNVSPNYFLEILDRLMKVIKDHCGILSEESIRKNFVLIYEIIGEMFDFGYPQLSSTEQIKPFVFNEPVVMMKSSNPINSILNKSTTSGESTKKPISQMTDSKSKKNEIFVDIIEKITVLFNSNGSLINYGVDGCIKMKSYLRGNPELRLVLNDDVSFSRSSYSGSYIDDCNFHPKVNTRDFQNLKTLYISPPDGEFIVMNYRMNTEFAPPFRIYTIVEEGNYKIELKVKVQSNFIDKYNAGNVVIKFNVPKSTQNVNFDLGKSRIGQKVDYVQAEKVCIWKIPKIQGGNEHSMTARIHIQNNNASECRKEIGPITMSFEIPSYNISKLQVKELKVLTNEKNYNALRWVRVVTQANSYVTRVA